MSDSWYLSVVNNANLSRTNSLEDVLGMYRGMWIYKITVMKDVGVFNGKLELNMGGRHNNVWEEMRNSYV